MHIPCPECRETITDQLATCPKCGCSTKAKKTPRVSKSNVKKTHDEKVFLLDRANNVVFCPNGCPSFYSPTFEHEESKCPTCGAMTSLVCTEPLNSIPIKVQIGGIPVESFLVNQLQATTGRMPRMLFNAKIWLTVLMSVLSIAMFSVAIKQMLKPFPEYHAPNQTELDFSHPPSFQDESQLDNGNNGFTWRRMAEMEKRTLCDNFVSRFGLTEDFYFNALNSFYGYNSTTESLKMSIDDVAGMAARAHDMGVANSVY
jgi:hypothetical protein